MARRTPEATARVRLVGQEIAHAHPHNTLLFRFRELSFGWLEGRAAGQQRHSRRHPPRTFLSLFVARCDGGARNAEDHDGAGRDCVFIPLSIG
jgi:hypothetical protein